MKKVLCILLFSVLLLSSCGNKSVQDTVSTTVATSESTVSEVNVTSTSSISTTVASTTVTSTTYSTSTDLSNDTEIIALPAGQTYSYLKAMSDKSLVDRLWITETGDSYSFFSNDTGRLVSNGKLHKFTYSIKGSNLRVSFDDSTDKAIYIMKWQDDSVNLVNSQGTITLYFSTDVAALSEYIDLTVNNIAVWRVTDTATDNSAYLFDTYHVLDDSFTTLPNYVKAILKHCDSCYFEVTSEDVYANPSVEDALYYSGDDSLRRHMTEQGYKDFKTEFINIYGYYPDLLDTVKLPMVSNTLSVLALQQIQDMNQSSGGIDQMLEDYCLNFNIPIFSIEDLDAHYASMAPNGDDEFYEALLFDTLESVKNTHDYAAGVADMYSAWLSGDFEHISDLIYETCDTDSLPDNLKTAYDEYLKVLMYDRNDVFVSCILNELKDSDIEFFAIGAAHYGGEHGIINQLKELGYSIERVN